MGFTPEQEKAIKLRGKNILVAAAAGSGKTTILVERIKKLIIEDGVGIDEMLVVTFTNAAAREMREKIIKTINEELEKSDSEFLRNQLDLIHSANISTFHAFGIQVIKENFQKIAIEPGFKICNEAQSAIFKQEAVDKLLDLKYEAEDEAFLDFVDAFGSERFDGKIINMIMDGHDALMSLPHPWEEIEAKSLMLEDLSFLDDIGRIAYKEIKNTLAWSERACKIARNADILKIFDTLSIERTLLEAAVKKLEKADYVLAAKVLNELSFKNLAASKEEKEKYELVKEEIKFFREKYKNVVKDLKKRFFYAPLETIIEDLKAAAVRTRTFITLIKQFDELYKEEKAKHNLLDFSDIEHYALDILDEEEVQEVYRKKFKYIFVDEYQDSNLVQEAIIEKIARENNRFLVGDVKQSIYKFRLAEPEIFYEKYRRYASGDDENSIKIDLNKNFRSKGHIIDSVNLFFEELMDGYDADSALYKGDAYDGELDYQTELHVVNDSIDDTQDLDDAIVQLQRAENEALAVSQIVKENLGKEIFDSKAGKVRKIEKKDIVILMRSVKTYAQAFTNVLLDAGIPSFVNDSEGYYDTIEIDNMVNLLKVIDNRKQDIPLISVLYSDIFRFGLEELIDIRNNHRRGPFYEAWLDYAQNGPDEKLQSKCLTVIGQIERYKKLAIALPLDEFIWQLMLDSGLYIAMGALPGGVQRQANLRALVDKATEYQENTISSLFSFIKYIEKVQEKEVSIGQVKLVGENDDLIRIMTIHKSKGLEFPVVIVSGMGKRLSGNSKSITFHKNYGLALPIVNTKEHWKKNTILQNIINTQNELEKLEEDVRVFYVALTRAKDKLIMIATIKDREKLDKKISIGASGNTSYLDMVLNIAASSADIELKYHDAASIGRAIYHKKRKLNAVLNLFDNSRHIDDVNLRDKVEKRLAYVYPYEKAVSLKQKYSVSELNKEDNTYYAPSLTLADTAQTRTGDELTAAEKGTAYHMVMEHLPFEKMPNAAVVEDTIKALVEKKILTKQEADAVKTSEVMAFFASSIGMRAVKAAQDALLFKETPFTYAMDIEGEEIFVQGIIDCFFIEEGEIVLIDYKTNYISCAEDKERVRKTYKIQLQIYKEALAVGKGLNVKETHLYLNGISEFVSMD